MNRIKPSPILFAAALLLALSPGRSVAADGSITVTTWVWEGEGSWFSSPNWDFGDLFAAPTESLPVYFGPQQQTVNGIPTGGYTFPGGGAVMEASFSSPSLNMVAYDGPSTLTIRNGATYTTSANVGMRPANGYVPAGPVQPATLNLCDGDLAGSWTIGSDSAAVLNVCGNVTVENLALASSSDSSVTLNLGSGANFHTPNGLHIGFGNVTVNNSAHFIQEGRWSGTVSQWNNNPASSLVIRNFIDLGATISNQGLITFAGGDTSSGADEILYISGPVTLTGGGEVVLVDRSSAILTFGTSSLLNLDNVIRGGGGGLISVPLTNRHIVRADRGVLNIGSTLENSAGTVEVKAGATVDLNGNTLNGLVIIETGGRIHSGMLEDVTSPGTLTVDSRSITLQGGSFTNRGLITFAGDTNSSVDELLGIAGPASLRGGGPVRLTGGGEVVLVDENSAIRSIFENSSLLNVDNVIRGSGRIEVALTNRHIVRAEHGLLKIGYLGYQMDNSAGTVEVKAGATVDLNGTMLNGLVIIETGGRIHNGTFEDVTSPGTLTVDIHPITLQGGSFTNRGLITFAGDTDSSVDELLGIAGPASQRGGGPVRLTGGGEVVLVDENSTIRRVFENSSLLNVDNVIRGGGGGQIQVPVTNRGTIFADRGTLNLAASVASLTGARYGAASGAALKIGNGSKTLDLPEGTTLFGDGLIAGTVITAGVVAPGSSIGTLSIADNLTLNGSLHCELDGRSGDRLVVVRQLVITNATLDLQLLAGGATRPVYVIASYGTLVGSQFARILGLPAGYAVNYAYQGNQLALVQTSAAQYNQWALASGLSPGINDDFADDPNGDGRTNLEHFAFDTAPLGNGGSEGKRVVQIAEDEGQGYLTYTVPVRVGATFSGAESLGALASGIRYTVLGDDDLLGKRLAVKERSVLATGMPPLRDMDGDLLADWEYHTFRLTTPVGPAQPAGFLWIQVTPE